MQKSVSEKADRNRRQADLPPTAPMATRPASPPHADLARNITLLCLSALTIMSGATISPSLPAIEAYFSASENAALLTRFVLTIPALFIALCAPVAGYVADRLGRRPLVIGSVLLYAIAGMSGLFLDTLPAILVGRALLGVSVAGVMTGATALVGDYFSGPARERFMGYQSTFIGFGGLIFLTGGGLLAELHWRAPFAVYGAALVLLPMIFRHIAEPTRSQPEPGTRSGDAGPPNGMFIIVGVFAAAILNSLIFYTVPTQLPFYLRALGAEAPTLTGLAIGGMTLTSALVSFVYGRVRGRMGAAGVFALAFALMGAGLLLVGMAGSYVTILPALAVTGAGLGLMMPNLGATAMGAAPSAIRGRIAGGLTASIFIGQFISPVASQPAIAHFGFAATYGFAGAIMLAAAVVALTAAAKRAQPAFASR